MGLNGKFQNWKSAVTHLDERRLGIAGLCILFVAFMLGAFFAPVWAIIVIAALLLSSGGILYILSSRLAGVNTESDIERSELKNMLLNLDDALLVYDSDFKIVFFNVAAERLFHIRGAEVIGKAVNPRMVSDEKYRLLAQAVFTSLAPVMVSRSDAGVYPQVTDLQWEDPFLAFRTLTMPIKNEQNRIIGFMKIIKDRTRELTLLRSKDEFVTVASHQLRTPVTNLRWSLESLAQDPGLSENAKTYLKSAENGVSLLLTIVEDLLKVSKIEEGRFGYNFTPIDLMEFLSGLLAEVNAEAEKFGIKIYFERPETPLPKVIADAAKITMVFANLLDNAIRYNVKDGQVTVKVRKVESQPFVEVQIKDTGLGIPKDDLQKLFTKFFRAENVLKAQTEGSGLGLYIVKNIVQAHGGKVSVSSELNRGTTFTFTLPTEETVIPPREVPTIEY